MNNKKDYKWCGPSKADEGWSEWLYWGGIDKPETLHSDTQIQVINDEGETLGDGTWHFAAKDCEWSEITAYRYKIKEPESDMHPDLERLARNVSTWPEDSFWGAWLSLSQGSALKTGFFGWPEDLEPQYTKAFTKKQWLQARKDLGLIMSDSEEEIPAPEWSGSVPDGVQTYKQLRYQDNKGEDWIDEFARTKSVDEFRGAMSFNIGKCNRRAGKKDNLIEEIEKMRDYCDRWIEYERSL